MTDSPVMAASPSRGRPLMLVGLLFAAAGIVAYAIQIAAKMLFAPWYLPVTGTLALLLIVASLARRRATWRVIVGGLMLLVVSGEWTFLIGSRLPAYAGPLAVGKPFPAFQTVRADGTAFTQRDLADGRDTAMVFFRGRW